MKKLLFVLLVSTLVVSNVSAQMRFGGNVNINSYRESGVYNQYGEKTDQKSFQIVLKPKFFWYLNEKMQLGTRLGFGYGNLKEGIVFDQSAHEDETLKTGKSIGWSLAPYYSYRLLNWKIVSVWLEANAYVGQFYNVSDQKEKSSFPEMWGRQTEYGFQVLPVVAIDITETLALDLHVGILSLGWAGSTSHYDDGTTSTTSYLDIRKGGWDGLVQGLTSYGIGIYKRF